MSASTSDGDGHHGHALGARSGFGEAPALLVVDMSLGFTDPRSDLACDVERAIPAIRQLLTAARRSAVPVLYTTVAYTDAQHAAGGAFAAKIPALARLRVGAPLVQIDPRVAPLPTEPVISKLYASAFFATPLMSLLVGAAVDSVVITGASTSGCVRATAVDAVQHGLRVVVPREAVGDRDVDAHEQSLRDIDSRYGDVVALEDALRWIENVRDREVAR